MMEKGTNIEKIEDWCYVILTRGRLEYHAVDLVTPKNEFGHRCRFDILAVLVDTDPDGYGKYELVDYVYGIGTMDTEEIWTHFKEIAEADSERRDRDGKR